MNKDFFETLKDGFKHITEIGDPEEMAKLREDGVIVDDEGYYSFSFGEHHEFELCIEPLLEDSEDNAMFKIALYKNRVLLTQKLEICVRKPKK